MAELVPIPFPSLLKRVFHEYRANNAIFDLPVRKFYRPSADLDLSVSFCGNRASNPVGPAAGPQTQLAQNIALSWLAGSRILELKTIQINDRLELSRPCIDVATIGFNTEWSQELTLDQSLREYVKGSMMQEILQSWLFAGQSGCDTVFDISVGYDLAGIQSAPVQQWLRTMRDASSLIEEYRAEIPYELAAYRDLPFRTELANSITLSTFHGTPANEIERICEFLIREMDYHVIVKMNPPMLGKQRLEHLLYERLGYHDVEVNQNVYAVNIAFNDAVDVVRRLQDLGARHGKTVGVKFGNTLEVRNTRKYLQEEIQYLSGQPLHVLHLALVQEWRQVFGPEFPISFSAGVDANNFADCAAIGLVPVTTSTDLMRPGGYGRLPQYLLNLEHSMKSVGAGTIEEYILRSPLSPAPHADRATAIMANTAILLEKSIANPRFHAEQNKKMPRKIGSHLHLWDCINCDKCVPVCPNDANFYFSVEKLEILYKNIEIEGPRWQQIDGGEYKIAETHQIANFADACNECGNCDVFCPEDGGPYIEKPRFFGSLDSYNRWTSLSGFFLTRNAAGPVLYGRFKDQEFMLVWRTAEGVMTMTAGGDRFSVDAVSDAIRAVEPGGDPGRRIIDMRYYFAMKTLMKGMLNESRVHFVNVGLGSFATPEQSHA